MLFCFKQSKHDKKCFISVNRCNYKQSSLTRHWCACLVIIIMMKFMTLIIRHVNVIAYNLVLEQSACYNQSVSILTAALVMSKVCSIDLLSVGELLALLDFPLANRKLLLRLDKKPPRCHLLGSCSCTSVISFTSQAMTHNPAHHNSKVCQKAGIKHTLRTFNIVLSPSPVKQSTDKPCYWSIGTCDFLLLEIRNSKYFNK